MRGTDLARAAGNVAHADAVEAMLQQLLIILVGRHKGGEVTIPVSEIDATNDRTLALQYVEQPDGAGAFRFVVRRKQ